MVKNDNLLNHGIYAIVAIVAITGLFLMLEENKELTRSITGMAILDEPQLSCSGKCPERTGFLGRCVKNACYYYDISELDVIKGPNDEPVEIMKDGSSEIFVKIDDTYFKAIIRSEDVLHMDCDGYGYDLNDNGIIDAADIQLAINAVGGKAACNADINGDGSKDMLDIQAIVNQALA